MDTAGTPAELRRAVLTGATPGQTVKLLREAMTADRALVAA